MILEARLATLGGEKQISDLDRLWAQAVSFLTSFDARQVRYAGLAFANVVEGVVRLATAVQQVCHLCFVLGFVR